MVDTVNANHHPNSGCGTHTLLVSKMIGSAYDVVKYVACSMNYIQHISHHMEDVHNVSLMVQENQK